jgi:hypothetical protein
MFRGLTYPSVVSPDLRYLLMGRQSEGNPPGELNVRPEFEILDAIDKGRQFFNLVKPHIKRLPSWRLKLAPKDR